MNGQRYGINEIYIGCRVLDKVTGSEAHVLDITDEVPKSLIVQLADGYITVRQYEELDYLPQV